MLTKKTMVKVSSSFMQQTSTSIPYHHEMSLSVITVRYSFIALYNIFKILFEQCPATFVTMYKQQSAPLLLSLFV